jgi:phosphoglycolate phosphatase-like HAD superfamily hydrolase
MRYRNVIFDFDGTLTDSRRDIAGAQLWALRQMGFDGYQEEDLYPLIGKSLKETFEHILPPAHHHRISEAIALYAEYYPPRALQSTVLFPGVRETLSVLRSRGHRLAVASTKKGEGIRRATEQFGITGEFERLQGSENMAFKPAPDVILAILSHLAWDPHETVMVGDSDVDILAGRNAGVDSCAVTYGSLSRTELLLLHPEYILDRISDLLPIAETGGGRSGHLHTRAQQAV